MPRMQMKNAATLYENSIVIDGLAGTTFAFEALSAGRSYSCPPDLGCAQ